MLRFYIICSLIFSYLSTIAQTTPSQKSNKSCQSSQLIIDEIEGAKPYTSLDLNNDDCQFQFAIVTDRTGGHRPGVFMDGVNKLNLLQPEFVMSVGDLIEGYTEDTIELNKQWNEFEGFVSALEMPFFYLPGNHDITNEVMEKVYLERFGKTFYHFIYKDVLFLCLNTEDQWRGSNKGTISDPQFEYIKNILDTNNDVRWTFVFMHQPLWILENTERWNDVETLLDSRKHTVFVGHHHHYVKYERNNGKYFMLATTGGSSPLRGPQLGEFDHVVWVTMTDEGPIFANLLLNGIWGENVVTEGSVDFFQSVINRNPIRIVPMLTDETTFKGGQVSIKVFNDDNIPMHVEWDKSFSWSLKASFNKPSMNIPPNSVDSLVVDLEVRKGEQPIEGLSALPIKASVTLESETYPGITIPFNYNLKPVNKESLTRAPREVTIDGDLSDWDDLPYRLQNLPEESISASFGLNYTDDALLIAVKVMDDQLFLDTGEVAWRQDFIGLVVNADELAISAMRYGAGWYTNSILFTVAPATEALPASTYYDDKLPEGTLYHCHTIEGGYVLEAAIPIQYIKERQGEDWESIRFNLIVQDRDEETEAFPRYRFKPDWRGPDNYIGSGLFFKE